VTRIPRAFSHQLVLACWRKVSIVMIVFGGSGWTGGGGGGGGSET